MSFIFCNFAAFFEKMKRNAFIFIVLSAILVLFCCLDICSGSLWLWPWGDLSPMEHNILHAIRLPKAFTAILAGAALSVSGLIMQTLFRNPLAGPYTLGVSSGVSLGVALLTMLGGILSTFNFQLSFFQLYSLPPAPTAWAFCYYRTWCRGWGAARALGSACHARRTSRPRGTTSRCSV